MGFQCGAKLQFFGAPPSDAGGNVHQQARSDWPVHFVPKQLDVAQKARTVPGDVVDAVPRKFARDGCAKTHTHVGGAVKREDRPNGMASKPQRQHRFGVGGVPRQNSFEAISVISNCTVQHVAAWCCLPGA